MGLSAALVPVAAPAPPGFIVWGLFATFGALVAGYAIWMFWIERRDDADGGGD